MSEDLFRYKIRFLTLVLILSYSYLHIELAGVYVDASFASLVDLKARLPFGQRLLIPYMAHFISAYLPLPYPTVFFLIEVLFVALSYFAVQALFRHEFSNTQAQAFSWLFLLLLPLIFVVNYRFTIEAPAPFYYPFDTATLFFMVAGYLFCLQKHWRYFIPWVFLATLNRESSILLVFLIPALHWQEFRRQLTPFFLAVLSYLLARYLVLFLVRGLPGSLFELYHRQLMHTFFSINLYWLLNMKNLLLFVFCLAATPLFWFVFYDHIPYRYRPVRYLCLAYFIGLLFVGNFMEARIFGEIFVLLYLPACIGLTRCLNGDNPYFPDHGGIRFFIARYSVMASLMLIVLLRQPINSLIVWLLPYP